MVEIKQYRLCLYLGLFLINSLTQPYQLSAQANGCYDTFNRPIRCDPEFVNAAYNKTVIASNTCGNTETEYCLQTNRQSDYEICDVCISGRPEKSHPPEYMNDYKNTAGLTWWQSDTMEYNIQYPNSVNITIHLGKSFDITYVQVKFYSSRPESFAIYKRTNETSEWEPYQYYSASCEQTYNKITNEIVLKNENEARALCSDEFSDIAPLSGGSVAFSTLENRPSAYDFQTSKEMSDWVTATDIRLSLDRLNTFGDDIFGDPKVLRSYFYAISDISIGGRCKCHGHAEKCIEFEDKNFEMRLKCECTHNTAGVDCEKCAPFYNDSPWAPAPYGQFVDVCRPCNCNGLSDECEFREALYTRTGSGGYCLNCRNNTEGQNCQNCKHGFFRNILLDSNDCLDCKCHPEGSVSAQCAPNGQCTCKPGVTGVKCNQCMPGYYDLSILGCKECMCDPKGSYHSPARCNPINGKCDCKDNVEGQNCDRCKPGYFDLDQKHPEGCLQCFCFGHTSQCSSAFNYVAKNLTTTDKVLETYAWTASNLDGSVQKTVSRENEALFVYNTNEDIWFNAPSYFLGNQRSSYGRYMSFVLKFQLSHSSAVRKEVILEGNGIQIYRSIYDSIIPQNQYSMPQEITETFKFLLKENSGWRPTLSKENFNRLLLNLTAIRIKTTFSGLNFLTNFTIQSYRILPELAFTKETSPVRITSVETCVCPEQYKGQHCENCQVGFTRHPPNADSFAKCVPCSCNNHSIACDPNNGKCDCIHNTVGENCERCRDGYYGNALVGSPIDCKQCPCPNGGPCTQIYNFQSDSTDVVCLACPTGTRGNLCDTCEDGYFGFNSETNTCQKCDCNGNIDENAIGNCDSVTGKCLRCTYNTTGSQCESCLPGYWGDALSEVKCHPCECSKAGAKGEECDLKNGQCVCRPNVIGRKCDECADTFWNLVSGEGCTDCDCSPLGSVDLVCNKDTAQCHCQPGVKGLKCDKCLDNFYGYSGEGCKSCECDSYGSLIPQCDELGRCVCKNNIAGNKCNKCQENYSNFTAGCVRCDNCYDLIDTGVHKLRMSIGKIEKTLASTNETSIFEETKAKNRELKTYMDQVFKDVEALHTTLFIVDVLPSSYSKSVDQALSTFNKINSDFVNISKTINDFDNQVELYQVTKKKLTVLKNKNDLLTSSYTSNMYVLSAHLDTIESKHSNLEGDALTIKNLAKESRKAAEGQKNSANDFFFKVQEFISSTRDLIYKLDMLGKKLQTEAQNLPVQTKTGNSEAVKEAELLVAEASQIKTMLEQNVSHVKSKTVELAKLNLSEKEVIISKDIDVAETALLVNNNLVNHIIERERKSFEEVKLYTKKVAERLNEINGQIRLTEVNESDMSKLVERSDMAKNKIEKAVKLATDSFANISSILETFENFDQVLSKNSRAAETARSATTDIDINVNECQFSLDSSREILTDSQTSLREVVEVLKTTNMMIEEEVKETNRVKNRTNEFDIKQNELGGIVKGLSNRATINLESLSYAQMANQSFGDRFSSIQNNVETVAVNSNILLSSINSAVEDIDILNADFIKRFKDVSLESIKELSDKFDKALEENDSENEELDADIEELVERNKHNHQVLIIYEREIPELKKQVADLSLLQSSLENKCDYYRNEKRLK